MTSFRLAVFGAVTYYAGARDWLSAAFAVAILVAVELGALVYRVNERRRAVNWERRYGSRS